MPTQPECGTYIFGAISSAIHALPSRMLRHRRQVHTDCLQSVHKLCSEETIFDVCQTLHVMFNERVCSAMALLCTCVQMTPMQCTQA